MVSLSAIVWVFWVSQINGKRLQTIAAIALDIFAIPVSSAPVEPVISLALLLRIAAICWQANT